MLEEIRRAVARRRDRRTLERLVDTSQKLLSEQGEMNGMVPARELVAALEDLDDGPMDGYFDFLARELDPDPDDVLAAAQAYAAAPGASSLMALTAVTESKRQELLRRLNRAPGGTAAVLHLRRALRQRLADQPALRAIDADMQHLLNSWFNPGFLQMSRVDWQAPAQLLERIIHHEAVHAIDGWDDLRRRLQPDRRCFAFFHPQLPQEPLIFVEVALLTEIPAAIAPLIDKASTPQPTDKARVAAFYSISNCEPGLRGVSLGNFLIKGVAEQLKSELPQLKTFCTLSPIPGFARWLIGGPDLDALPGLTPAKRAKVKQAHALLLEHSRGDLAVLRGAKTNAELDETACQALQTLAAAFLLLVAPTPAGDPVARFHLDNGARLERINLRADLSAKGLRQSFGLMVNYLYDLDDIERAHTRFRQGEVVHARAVGALL